MVALRLRLQVAPMRSLAPRRRPSAGRWPWPHLAASRRRARPRAELEDQRFGGAPGRFIGRMHAVGAAPVRPSARPPDAPRDGAAAADCLLDSTGGFVAGRQRDGGGPAAEAIARSMRIRGLRREPTCDPSARRLPSRQPPVERRRAARRRPRRRPHGARRCRTCGCCSPATGRGGRRASSAPAARLRPFMDFDGPNCASIEPLRTLRMIRHNAWMAQRWNDPAFPAAFRGSAARATGAAGRAVREQMEAMAETPAWPPGRARLTRPFAGPTSGLCGASSGRQHATR